MRIALVALLCLAVGFGAGWAVFEEPWKDEPEAQFAEDSLARALTGSIRGAKDASCTSDHGPFYTCVVYASANSGETYNVEVNRTGRCFSAKAQERTPEDELMSNLQPDGFKSDPSLPSGFRGWFNRAEC